MAIKRVLTIESIDEPTTRRMLESIYSLETFKDYEIDHCFFLKPSQKSTDRENLFSLLNNSIKRFNPDVVLLHTGNYFFKHKKIFMDVIPKLKSIYPHILFGIQRREIIENEVKNKFDYNDDLVKIEDLFFKIDR